MIEHEASIHNHFEAYKSAVLAKDVEAFIALYDATVRVFDLWNAWSYDGIEAWRDMVTGWFGSLGTTTVMVHFQELQLLVSSDMAVAHAFVTYQGNSAEGETLHAMRNRLTWSLRFDGYRWKVVHEHTSAPVNMDTSTVILKSSLKSNG